MKSLMPQIDSNDGLFHNGNPATGEQGTRVTDTWLNNLQDRVRDVQAEAHCVLQKAGFQPVENKQTQLYEAIVKIIDDNRKKASTTQKGEVQLYSGYDSESEEMAATPKVIKILKGFIDSIVRSLTNYIPNSKKSSAVNSNSSDTVATSAAVKIVNDNANDRVAKSGDTMTGNLSLAQGDYSGLNLYNNDGYYTRFEGNPHNNNSLLTLAYRTPQGTNIAVVTLPKKHGVVAYAGDVVSKSGDSMLGTLSFSGATDSYRIGGYTWRMPIRFSGDVVIGNEKCAIGFNNNGSLHFGGLPGASQFTATLDSEKLWVAGDVKTSAGKSLNTALQPNDLVYQKIGNFEVRKYPDGTMLQTYFVDFNDVHGANSGLGGPGPKQLTWAVSFVGKPLVWGNITSSIEDSHDVGVNILTKSTGTTLYWYNYEHSNPNQGACRLQFLAIGRWK
ncbi:phage tail protein [Haemophilus parainfluenzae]|uniref:phage tail protein n=1 Tax=Haemophilus parainfluenzae TaxID=729 RepID=UPI00025B19D8|nr:phage tail protein [Haemophilus parainfluenzae]EIF38853.1 phage tail fiber repeat protein [Haemophilus parainfluenzae HK262]OBX73140.1 hypothetical protein A9296_09625 [Haemophilus parainfluenzae]